MRNPITRRGTEPVDPQEAVRQVAEAVAAPPPQAEAAPDPHTAAAQRLTAEAAQLRADTAHAQQEADQVLAELRADAARRIADAERAAQAARQAVLAADRRAQELEGNAGLHRHALAVAAQISDAEALLAALQGEAADLRGQAAGLDKRIAELALARQATGANIRQAVDDQDAAAVATLRAQLAGSEEITAALTGKLTPARQRLAAIGESDPKGIGAQSDALRRLEALRADQQRVLDAIDPARPGAPERAFAARLQELSAYAAKHPTKTPPAATSVGVAHPGGGTTQVVSRRL